MDYGLSTMDFSSPRPSGFELRQVNLYPDSKKSTDKTVSVLLSKQPRIFVLNIIPKG